MKIFVVRHGEALDDVEDCYGGAADFPLTDAGREQATAVAKELKRSQIQAVFTSPLRRASETADIIARELGLSVETVNELRERNSYGVLSGVNKDKAKQIFGYLLQELTEKPGYSRESLLGAEDFDLFIDRVRRALDIVTRQCEARRFERALVVTHGTFTRALFQDVFGFDGTRAMELGAINVVTYTRAAVQIAGLD